MTPEEQVRKAIAKAIWMDNSNNDTGFEYIHKEGRIWNISDQILNLKYPNGQPMIAILDERQKLPENQVATHIWAMEQIRRKVKDGYDPAQEVSEYIDDAFDVIFKEGWRKCL